MTAASIATVADLTSKNPTTSDSNQSCTDWEKITPGTALSRPCVAVLVDTAGTMSPIRLGQVSPEANCTAINVVAGAVIPIQAWKFASPTSGTPAALYALFNTMRLV